MKLFAIALACMWATGATTGYFIAKWDLQQANAIATNQKPIALSSKQADMRDVKPSKTSRELLEEKYRLCDGTGDISRISDVDLDKSVQKICLEKS